MSFFSLSAKGQIMILMIIGAIAGASIGWFSYAHQKMFFACLGTLSVFAGVVYAKVIIPTLLGAIVRGIDIKAAFDLIWGKVPMEYREALALALICMLVGRVATYLTVKTRQNLDDIDPEKAAARKRDKVKAQARKQYGLDDTVEAYRHEKEAQVATDDVIANMRKLYSKAA